MLYIIHCANHPDLAYRGGQGLIIHIEADLYQSVAWANANSLRWAFTLSNAGSRYFEDRCDLARLGEIDWDSIKANNWKGRTEGKQAEFLCETQYPFSLTERICVQNRTTYQLVVNALAKSGHHPRVEIRPDWYY
jgi:hypothetical protein